MAGSTDSDRLASCTASTVFHYKLGAGSTIWRLPNFNIMFDMKIG